MARHLLVLTVLVIAGCSNRSSTEKILIGHIAPLDKPAGEHAKQGMLLAVEEVNDSAPAQRVAVVHVDSRGDGAVAQAEAVRLVTVNKVVGLVVSAEPGRVERIAKELEPYGVPIVTLDVLSATPPGENLFAINLTAAQQGRALARYATQQLKPARVAVIADQRSATGMAVASAFVKECLKEGPTRVEQWTYDNVANLPELVNRVKKMQPEAVCFAGMAGDLAALRTQLHNAELRTPLLFGGEDSGEISSDARDDVYLATCYALDAVAEGESFVGKYRERFKETPDVHAALAYDAVRTMAKALSQAKPMNGPELRNGLAGTESFTGLTGAFAFGRDRIARRTVLIVHWKDSQAKIVTRYPGE